KIVLPDGRVIWVMARCGNFVEKGKNPLLDVGANDEVSDQLQDGGPTHTVSDGDGSQVPNGIQHNPEQDAEDAEDKANKQNKEDKKKHDDDKNDATNNGGGTVDDDDHAT